MGQLAGLVWDQGAASESDGETGMGKETGGKVVYDLQTFQEFKDPSPCLLLILAVVNYVPYVPCLLWLLSCFFFKSCSLT